MYSLFERGHTHIHMHNTSNNAGWRLLHPRCGGKDCSTLGSHALRCTGERLLPAQGMHRLVAALRGQQGRGDADAAPGSACSTHSHVVQLGSRDTVTHNHTCAHRQTGPSTPPPPLQAHHTSSQAQRVSNHTQTLLLPPRASPPPPPRCCCCHTKNEPPGQLQLTQLLLYHARDTALANRLLQNSMKKQTRIPQGLFCCGRNAQPKMTSAAAHTTCKCCPAHHTARPAAQTSSCHARQAGWS